MVLLFSLSLPFVFHIFPVLDVWPRVLVRKYAEYTHSSITRVFFLTDKGYIPV